MVQQNTGDSNNTNNYGADMAFEEDLDKVVLYEKVDKHIAKISLNRPQRANAMLMPNSWDQMAKHLQTAQDDDEVKVIILTGIGQSFCAGVDLRRTPVESFGLRKGQRLPQSYRIRGIASVGQRSMGGLLGCSKTVIAAVDGPAVAAGFSLVMDCDLVVASDRAFFGVPESRIGFAGFDPNLLVILTRLGVNRGYEAIITGRKVPAHEMKEWGVVSSIVPAEKLQDEAMRYAKAVAYHSTDNLMLGRMAMQMFWNIQGVAQYNTFATIAHPLFTNLVWRDDEFNFLRERNKRGLKGAVQEMGRIWKELGFED